MNKISRVDKMFSLGFSLIELLLSMAVIVLIIFASLRFYSSVQNAHQIRYSLQAIKDTREAAAEWAKSTADYTGISMTLLKNSGLLPAYLDDGSAKTPWTTNIVVQANATTATELDIVFKAPIPEWACLSLKQNLSNQAVSITPTDCANTDNQDLILTFA